VKASLVYVQHGIEQLICGLLVNFNYLLQLSRDKPSPTLIPLSYRDWLYNMQDVCMLKMHLFGISIPGHIVNFTGIVLKCICLDIHFASWCLSHSKGLVYIMVWHCTRSVDLWFVSELQSIPLSYRVIILARRMCTKNTFASICDIHASLGHARSHMCIFSTHARISIPCIDLHV
jgi:hypothetical protein